MFNPDKALRSFIRARRSDHVPLKHLLWWDMYLIGTLLNLAFLGLAFGAVALSWPEWLAVVIFLLPLPYNLFIWSAVWRSAGIMGGLACGIARCLATGWLTLAFFV